MPCHCPAPASVRDAAAIRLRAGPRWLLLAVCGSALAPTLSLIHI